MAGEEFTTTRWSVVLRARDRNAEEAMDYLCRSYWAPLYAFALRSGHGADAARDLTQGFFVGVLEGRYLKNVREGRGRFRSFLLGCFKHYLAHEWKKGQALKRGGASRTFSIDAETDAVEPPSDRLSPEAAYDRQWALTLLDNVVRALRERYRRSGNEALFEALKPALSEAVFRNPEEVGERLGLSDGAVKVAVHRLRRRYRDELRRQVAETLDETERVGDELDFLISVL